MASKKKHQKSSRTPRATQASHTASECVSTVKPKSGAHGQKLIEVLERCWRFRVSLQSDYFRANAVHIAMAASLGLITTKVGKETFANSWHITKEGLEWIS